MISESSFLPPDPNNPCKCKRRIYTTVVMHRRRVYAGGIRQAHHMNARWKISSKPNLSGWRNPVIAQSSVSRSSRLILNIMMSNPMVTIINKAKPNHPNIMAVVPTPDLTLPLPRSWAIVLAATDAVCCHSTETSTKTEATKMRARAICDTGLEGKGLTSLSEPRSSVSSCQPGKVARRMKQIKARMIATMLRLNHISQGTAGSIGLLLTSDKERQCCL